ncbi:OmpA family protein [Ferruginibacter lapsinanis]|uniref:OmpA family protein n=1 Tax=Ferruginibacter lapsinanis TaxID=563172 RepID=UPI001E65BA52|nr:OmpA family protein [Ferruginibacter lapsinanis]UEG51097.1 OmpA family protein [Ferruginibacter lapsinanis]
MSLNLLDSSKGLITRELIAKASFFLGENQSNVSKAIGGILPSIVAGMVDKGATAEGVSTIVDLAHSASRSGFLEDLGSVYVSDKGSIILNKGAAIVPALFGENKTGALAGLISKFSGIKPASAASLLSLATPILLSVLGRYASSNNLNNAGVALLLAEQKNSVLKAMPGELDPSNIFNIFSGKMRFVPNSIASTATASTEEITGGVFKRSLSLLIMVIGAAAVFYFFCNGCSEIDTLIDGRDSLNAIIANSYGDNNAEVEDLGKVDPLTGDWLYNSGSNIVIDLPNNAGKLIVGENSTENKLYQFLSGNEQLDTVKGNWFECTNLHFKTGGAVLDSTSMTQLKNMVAITRAFPKAEFKFGGYTDNTGDSAANVILSQKRAEAVVDQLKKSGAAAASIAGAKGYGPQWPLADNATPEGRAQNRRVAVNVKAK